MHLRSNGWWLVLEATAIIASILLAFTIEAWWEERQDRSSAERLLLSVYTETQNNVEAVRFANGHRAAVRDACLRLFDLAAEETTPDLAEVDNLLGTLTWSYAPSANWGALDTLVEGGQLGLVENEVLRTQLAAQHRLKRVLAIGLRGDEEFEDKELYPYLRKNALLPQIAMTKSGLVFPGGSGKPNYDYNIRIKSPQNHVPLLSDPEFLGLLIQKLWIQLDALNRNDDFLIKSNSLVKSLEEELGIEN